MGRSKALRARSRRRDQPFVAASALASSSVLDRETCQRAQPFPLARRLVERPGQARERPATRGERDVARLVQRSNVVPERACLPRHAVVARRLAHEHEPLPRARARRVEEIPVARDGARALEPAAEARAARRRPGAARGGRDAGSSLPRARAGTRRRRRVFAHAGSRARRRARSLPELRLERKRARERRRRHRQEIGTTVETCQLLDLVERFPGGSVGACVPAGIVDDRRRVETPGVAQHRAEQTPRSCHRVGGGTQLGQRHERSAAQALALLFDPGGIDHGAAAQPPFDEVDRSALQPRVRRAKEREEIPTAAALPRETEHREERFAELRRSEPRSALDGVRDTPGAEDGVEWCAPALCRLAHDADPLGRSPASHELEHLGREQLRGAARACTLEEVQRAVESGAAGRLVGEQLALESRQRGRKPRCAATRKLLDRAASPAQRDPRRSVRGPQTRGDRARRESRS